MSKQIVMISDMIISAIMGLSFLAKEHLHSHLLGLMMICFSYAMNQVIDLNNNKGNQIALNTKSLFWIAYSLLSIIHEDYQTLMITIPMFVLTSYHTFFADVHGCSAECMHSKRARYMRKRINALKKRARNHPTVHDGYKTD